MSPWPISLTLPRQVSLARSFFFPFPFFFLFIIYSCHPHVVQFPLDLPSASIGPSSILCVVHYAVLYFPTCPSPLFAFVLTPLSIHHLFLFLSVILCQLCHPGGTFGPLTFPSRPFKAFIRMFQLSLFSCLLKVLHQCASFDKYLDSRRD